VTDAPLLAPIRHALAEEAAAVAGQEPPAVPLAAPAQPEMGDLASPVAMSLARAARRPPREIAEGIAARLRERGDAAAWLESVEVAGPGFLNMRLTAAWYAEAVAAMAAAGREHGAAVAEAPLDILLEFTSVNPTGPPHVGHARQAAYGDSLARILSFAGHTVTREYYVNDYGRQMRLFGESVAARYLQLCGREAEVPEGGYQGDYVSDLAAAVREEIGDRHAGDALTSPEAIALFTTRGEELMLAAIRGDLERFRVRFDRFFSERGLHEAGRVRAGIAALEDAGDAYEAEGAVWFRTTAYGDEKDRVLVRGDGETTYLAADVAYHLDKAGRGHDLLIDVLGADHHGYVARLRAVLAAGGFDPGTLEVAIIQLVSLLERGEARKMSKRAGTLVTLSDLIDDIGVDAARFFLVQRSHETALELDLALAREQSQENPVYYVQYAHARVAGILGQAGPPGSAPPGPPPALDPSERALTVRLAEWPVALSEAEERRAPHRVAAYLIELARDFHAFYHRCRVVGEAPAVEAFRLALCRATAGTVARGLDLLGVEAPERM
jgi:arginyl-tRNA synthetase